MSPERTVIIVSYRPGAWLEAAAESALAQPAEVVVVDNGSDGEEASDVARRFGARAVRCPRNLGFAGGVDAGLAHAHGEIVAVLNDDAQAGPGWLDSAADLLQDRTLAAVTPKVLLGGSYAEVSLDDAPWVAPGDARALGRQVHTLTVGGKDVLEAAVGGGIHDLERGEMGGQLRHWRWTAGTKPFYVPVDKPDDALDIRVNGEPVSTGAFVSIINHAGSYLRGHGVAGEYGLGAPDDGRFDEPAERFGFSATAPVFRAEVLHRLGGFAPQFFAYNEDTDWCLRARLGGFRIAYDPRSTVVHRLSATSGGARESFVRFLARRNALLCLIRNAPAEVARERVIGRIREGAGDDGVRRALLRKLPWAVASRRALSRGWVVPPREVWDAWAERDLRWDDGPAASAG